MPTKLDHLPVEILQLICQYLSCGDALQPFFNLNAYLNAVLCGCCMRTLSFQQITKAHFDRICRHLEPSRVVALTLTDDDCTPRQVQLFFTRFDLRDFVNLRSLTLLSVTREDILPILSDLPRLSRLTSLRTSNRSGQPLQLGQTLSQLPALVNLAVSEGDLFDHNIMLPLHQLKQLEAGFCHFVELRRLQRIVPSLVSLTIALGADHQLQLLADADTWSRLERLHLNLMNETEMTFARMDGILSHFKHLTHLTLDLLGDAWYLANGVLWENSPTIVSLQHFHFSFFFEPPFGYSFETSEEVLRSFASPFWCELKRWYVVVTERQVYTIERFVEHVVLASTLFLLSSAPDDRWLYSSTKRLQVSSSLQYVYLDRCRNLQELEVCEASILDTIFHNRQFACLRHLTVRRGVVWAQLSEILAHHPHITSLSLPPMDLDATLVCQSITNLQITEFASYVDRAQVPAICQVFPSVQQLIIAVQSIRVISSVIDGFPSLQNCILHLKKEARTITRGWLEEHTSLGRRADAFTHRSEPTRLVLWIDNTTAPKLRAHSVRKQRSEKCTVQ